MSYARLEENESEGSVVRPRFTLSLFSSRHENVNSRWSLIPLSSHDCLKYDVDLARKAAGFLVSKEEFWLVGFQFELGLRGRDSSFLEISWYLLPKWILQLVGQWDYDKFLKYDATVRWHLEKGGEDWDASGKGEPIIISSCSSSSLGVSRMFLGCCDEASSTS